MKYLKLYENDHRFERSLQDFLDLYYSDMDFKILTEFDCSKMSITNLKGIENFGPKLTSFDCSGNRLTNLKGIENFPNLEKLFCNINSINTLEHIKNLHNLKALNCNNNKLEDLDVVENLTKLFIFNFENNYLKVPLPRNFTIQYAINRKYSDDDLLKYKIYYNENIFLFGSYEFQKDFLNKYPERVLDLKIFGYHTDILNDPKYAWIFEQESNGFFGLKN